MCKEDADWNDDPNLIKICIICLCGSISCVAKQDAQDSLNCFNLGFGWEMPEKYDANYI